MDSQAQLKRTHAHHQAEEPIRIHHPEEEEHHEKGPAKVLKKVKEKAKKIKKALTKHGHGHEHGRGEQHIPDDHDLDEEDDEEDDYQDQQIHSGAPGKSHIPVKVEDEEIVPRGTKVFPVVSSSHTKHSEPVRATTLTPHNTPVSLLPTTADQRRRVNIERPRGLEEDPAAPDRGLGSRGGMSNYQSKVTDPTGKAGGEIGATSSVAALRRKKGTDEEDDKLGVGRDLPVRGPVSDHMKPEMGDHGSRFGKEIPVRSHEFDTRDEETQQPNQSSYTDKIASAIVAAKNAVASKLGYSGNENRVEGEEAPSSGGGYGSMVSEKLTPIYEKVKETGATVMTKLPSPLSGGGTGTETETHLGQDKGVSAKEYLSEKLSPGEEDKALSEVVAEKLHLGGSEENTTAPTKKGVVTQSEEVEKRLGGFSDQRSEEERKHGEKFAGEGEGTMADKLRDAVTSWVSGTTNEVVQKSTESSSETLGNTVGNMVGQQSGDNKGSVPVQKRFRESGN